jgi:TIR domain
LNFDQPTGTTAGRIFISYRRDDLPGDARALAQDLANVFGADNVFLDISLSGGSTWPARLRDELANAPVVLALIGPDWLRSTDEWNRRRIDSPTDWVRQEIETALADPSKLLIPVLLNGATLPPKEALPVSLANLADRQARKLSYETWRSQVDALVADIKRHNKWDRPANPAEVTRKRYANAQLRRVETILRTNGLTSAGDLWNFAGPTTEFVVPDLLPFQVDQPVTDRLTKDVAAHLRRAVRDRARYSSKEMLSGATPQHVVIVNHGPFGINFSAERTVVPRRRKPGYGPGLGACRRSVMWSQAAATGWRPAAWARPPCTTCSMGLSDRGSSEVFPPA